MGSRLGKLAFSCLLSLPILLASSWAAPLTEQEFKDPHLEAYKKTALKNRTPLILIHGIGPEKGDYYNWATYLEFLEDKKAFKQRYKIYFFHFNPKEPVKDIADELIESFIHLKRAEKIKSLRVIALSQGGLVFRRAYDHPEIQELSEKIITVGSPFHGTPLANKSWMKERMRRGSFFSPMRHSLKLTYHFVGKKSPNFENDYCWDNLDHGLHRQVNGNQPLKCHSTDLASQYKEAPFITYASFFGVKKKKQAFLLKELDLNIKLPKERSAFLLSRARVFNLTQNKIEKMPLYNVGNNGEPPFPLMTYNDGVTPVSSALWLGRFYHPEQKDYHPQIQLWDALVALKGKQKARLFSGIDHQNWMMDATRTRSKKVLDLLNPNEAEKSVFGWLLYDLMAE